ncbi:outer membrane beta-barrel protein [uncultured Chryseobacterium sp.]|uniref:outer membrane beta-barrel protein n=1 Tax=uncultured Chryseobacterium sp. TaxID=259322 RepID=UPI0025EF3F31|nr:outer membrane beta-barrel protein [uncultured Chryseobacterium sp.]
MIRKFIITGMVCLATASAYGQRSLKISLQPKEDTEVSPIVKEKMEDYAVKINDIIKEEKELMEAELIRLQEQGLGKAEFDEEKAKVAERYSEKIDQRIHDLGFDLDQVIQKQVRFSLLNSDVASNEEMKAQLLKKFRPTKEISPYITTGMMTLTNNLPDNELDMNMKRGRDLELGIRFNYQFGRTSPWGLVTGLGFSWRTIRLDNNMLFAKNSNADVFLTKNDGSLDKSKLRTGYIMIPLGFQYNFSKLKNAGMDVQYRPYAEGFRITANAYGGIKMSSNNIIKSDIGELRSRGNYQVNPFVYGAQLTLSYDDFSIFVKKDFSNFFKDGYFENDKALVFGIGIGL